MRKKGMVGTILAAVLVIALAVILVVSYVVLKNYVVTGGQLFARNQAQLDLRDRAITADEYNTLGWKMPETEILWSVPLSSGYFDSSSTELTITRMLPYDVDMLAYFPNLQTVDARQCTDYDALAAAWKQYPKVTFLYAVPIEGVDYGPDTKAVTLTALAQADIQLLEKLPQLETVDATGCREFDLLHQLAQQHPQWQVHYLTAIAGTEIDPNATEFSATGATYEELTVGLAAMPYLQKLTLHAPQADSAQLTALRQEYPGVEIHWDIEVFGTTFTDDATEVDISAGPIESVEQAKQIAGLFPNLEKFIVNSGDVENEDMSAYREEVRDQYKVVWTVHFTDKCKARTDETKFMPIDQGEYYFQDKDAYNLRYCEDMVCIDIGHSTVENVDFLAYMPHLKYLILAWTQVKDISPIRDCKELIYLELDHGIIHDFEPLTGCTALEDLNINAFRWHSSIEPLTKMTWLKNLWCVGMGYSKQQELITALPDTHVVTSDASNHSGNGWRNLQNYYDMRDYLGKPYMY